MESRLISVDEANQMLPLLRRIIEDVMAHWDHIIKKRTQLECLEKGIHPSGKGPAPDDREPAIQLLKQELNRLIDKINGYIREVEDLGCFVEEFKRGIVNFPSLCNGRKVFLCWRPDEAKVGFWHELDETYTERLPIRDPREFLCHRPVFENRS